MSKVCRGDLEDHPGRESLSTQVEKQMNRIIDRYFYCPDMMNFFAIARERQLSKTIKMFLKYLSKVWSDVIRILQGECWGLV